MNLKKATTIFIGVIFLVIAGYDIFVIAAEGFQVSISHTMIEWSYKYPLFPFLMGVVCGHLFWRMSDSPTTKKISDFVQGTQDDSKDRGN